MQPLSSGSIYHTVPVIAGYPPSISEVKECALFQWDPTPDLRTVHFPEGRALASAPPKAQAWASLAASVCYLLCYVTLIFVILLRPRFKNLSVLKCCHVGFVPYCLISEWLVSMEHMVVTKDQGGPAFWSWPFYSHS